MNYGELKTYDVANGPGVRVSLFVSGCENRCPGCFQPQTWDYAYGQPFTQETEDRIMEALSLPHIQGFSLLGGDPFEFRNQKVLAPLLRRIKLAYPDKDIWCWTGYRLYDDLQPGGKRYGLHTVEMLACIDALVDGPFIEEYKNLMIPYAGSENQIVHCLWGYDGV